MGKLFGTDGVRGVANIDLSVNLAFKIGLSITGVLTSVTHRKPRVLIGKDTRISCDMLEAALASGIAATGGDVVSAGIVPTPAVAFLVKECGFDAGVMISASHNSAEYNGIKIFNGDGYKLSDSLEEEIETEIANSDSIHLATHEKIGTIKTDLSLIEKYENHIKSINKNKSASPLRVVFDCANGSASVTAENIFESENLAECRFLHKDFDGLNINKNCGSTHMKTLIKTVKEGGYDIGIAFDGDADRCLAVDENGNLIDGDKVICALGLEMAKSGELNENTIVVTKLSNLGLHKFCAENGLKAEQTDVGDRYVLERMLEGGFGIGGEQSGHIIVTEYATTGDGQITAALILDLLRKKGGKVSEVFGEMKVFPQVSVNVKVANDMKQTIMTDAEVIAATEKVSCALKNSGRIILRPSGTEPLIRIMLEGENLEQINAYAKDVESVILSKIFSDLCI